MVVSDQAEQSRDAGRVPDKTEASVSVGSARYCFSCGLLAGPTEKRCIRCGSQIGLLRMGLDFAVSENPSPGVLMGSHLREPFMDDLAMISAAANMQCTGNIAYAHHAARNRERIAREREAEEARARRLNAA
jgi:hypothetical protein